MRDIEGEVRTNVNFFTDPIRPSEKTVVLTRNTAAQFELMNVLRARGYIHAKMLGNKSTRDAVLKLLGELAGPVASIVSRLNLRLDTTISASQNERYELLLALRASIEAWRKLFPAEDVDALDSRPKYVAWLEKVYADDAAKGDMLLVATIHAYKGRQAYRVCIFQPDTLPLPDRLKLEDDLRRCWEAWEERCIFFVAVSRAENKLHFMEHLEDGMNRTSLLTLWEPPTDPQLSNSTDDTVSAPASQAPPPPSFLHKLPPTPLSNSHPLPPPHPSPSTHTLPTSPLPISCRRAWLPPTRTPWTRVPRLRWPPFRSTASLPPCSSSKPSSSSTFAPTTPLTGTARLTRQRPSSASSTS